MDPKLKAEELLQKMKGFRVKHSHSKKCAIIFVDEILKLPSYQEGRMIAVIHEDYDYWKEVKSELQKL